MNPRCSGFHFVDQCPISPAEEKKSLEEECFKSRRGRALNALGANKKLNSSDLAAERNNSLFSVTLCDGKLDIYLLADQGSVADIMPKNILNKILSVQLDVQHEHLDSPIQLSTFDEKGDSIVCQSELVKDAMIHVRCGTTLSLHEMRWLICDQEAENVVPGRQTLECLGLNNRTMLAAACDRYRAS